MKARTLRLIALFALVALPVGAAASLTMCHAFSKPDAVKFSHKVHVGDEDMSCDECHGTVATAIDLKLDHLPKMKTCTSCHEDEEEDCAHCHTAPKRPFSYTKERRSDVVFSHKTHVEREKGGCDKCHAKVAAAESPSQSARPEMMDECMGCHRQDFRRIGCIKCHDNFRTLKEKPFGLFDHSADFLDKHGPVAKGNMQVCSHCHEQQSCNDCHSRMAPMLPSRMRSDEPDRLFMHRGDWMTQHPMEARMDTSRCLTCHKQERCIECHKTSQVGPTGGPGLGPHPSGWLTRSAIDFHGTAARRNIATCQACHDRGEASNCVACHKVGGSGGNPHPPGWSTRLDQGGQTCAWCHQR